MLISGKGLPGVGKENVKNSRFHSDRWQSRKDIHSCGRNGRETYWDWIRLLPLERRLHDIGKQNHFPNFIGTFEGIYFWESKYVCLFFDQHFPVDVWNGDIGLHDICSAKRETAFM